VLQKLARRIGLSLVYLAGLALCLLFGLAAVTARPGDRNLWPPSRDARTIEVFIVNHGYHSGIVVPRQAMASVAGGRDIATLGHVAVRFDAHDWLEIGWGDEEFYTQVQTIESLSVPMALRALFLPNNRSVLHVVGFKNDPRVVFARVELVQINLSEAGFARLVERLDASFTREERNDFPVELGPGLYGPSLFFRANGAFHLFHVCNHWVADLLNAAGLPTTPVLATLPAGLILDLKWRAGVALLPRDPNGAT
jgi:uncharacterized protein (TIGR02117 family)